MGKSSPNPSSTPSTPRKGAAGFIAHYQQTFGPRWAALEQALLVPSPRVIRLSGFATRPVPPAGAKPLAIAAGCFRVDADQSIAIERDEQGLLTGYVQDPASVLVARLLDAPERSRVLDLCAAPGGKSLILAERFACTGELVLNDRSPDRRKRLLQVLKDYVPPDVRSRIKVHQRDGRLWGKHERNSYDAILLDAPCSSEEHVLLDPRSLEQWSIKRIHRLSREQLALLRSAFEALKPGGTLLYCTCALTAQENDQVVTELLDRDSRARSTPVSLPIGEPTRLGWHVLPDTTGYGPLFVAQLNKT